MAEDDSFFDLHVRPLGGGFGKAIVDTAEGAVIEVDGAMSLMLARASILVACDVTDTWELTVAYEHPVGRWVGDLVPDSVEFALSREGSGDRSHEVYLLSIPEEPRQPSTSWKSGSRMNVVFEDDYFSIVGNAPALLSFAEHVVQLASPHVPLGTLLRYPPGKGLEKSSIPLRIQKSSFPEMTHEIR